MPLRDPCVSAPVHVPFRTRQGDGNSVWEEFGWVAPAVISVFDSVHVVACASVLGGGGVDWDPPGPGLVG